jgi:hypothetical protein
VTRYRTIVADPPWSYEDGWPVGSEMSQSAATAEAAGIPWERNRRTPMPLAQEAGPRRANDRPHGHQEQESR